MDISWILGGGPCSIYGIITEPDTRNGATMRPTEFAADTIIALLHKRTIASLPEVMAALGARASRRTAFRKLKDLAARNSYSHRGGYYTLDKLVDFDERGLWSFAGVRFSRIGTLIATAESFVSHAEAGHFGEELDNLLHVGTQDALRKLVRDGAADAAPAHRPVPVLRGRPAAAGATTARAAPAAGHARARTPPARPRADAGGAARRDHVGRQLARRAAAASVRRARVAQVRVGRRPAHCHPAGHRPVHGRHRPATTRRARRRGRPGAARRWRTPADGKKRRKSAPVSKP